MDQNSHSWLHSDPRALLSVFVEFAFNRTSPMNYLKLLRQLWPRMDGKTMAGNTVIVFPVSNSLFLCVQVQPVVSRSNLPTIPSGLNREDDGGRAHNPKKGAFHEIFNLPELERPLQGVFLNSSHLIVQFLRHNKSRNIRSSHIIMTFDSCRMYLMKVGVCSQLIYIWF